MSLLCAVSLSEHFQTKTNIVSDTRILGWISNKLQKEAYCMTTFMPVPRVAVKIYNDI